MCWLPELIAAVDLGEGVRWGRKRAGLRTPECLARKTPILELRPYHCPK